MAAVQDLCNQSGDPHTAMGNLLCFPHIVELRMLVSVYKEKIWGPVAPQESAENMLPGDSGHKSDRFYSQEALKG